MTVRQRRHVRANGGVLTIRASHDGPALDLDGRNEGALDRSLEAAAGDIVFDGVVTDRSRRR